ncbi:MAG: hypothetical protein WCF19_00150 [Chlamydiales bacterium]
MDIHLNTEESSPYGLEKRDEEEEQILLCALLSVGALGVAPFICKKKRIYTPFTPLGSSVPAPPEIAIECTAEEQEKIKELFGTIAKGGRHVVFSGIRLYQLGQKIASVHPFALLAAIPKHTMQTIFTKKSYIEDVLNGIDKGMRREHARNGIDSNIPRLAATFQKDPALIRPLIVSADWQGLVYYLFEIAP